MWTDREYFELRDRCSTDPQFNMMFRTVYRSIASGEVAIQDWRDAVNLAYTEWHSRNVGPIQWQVPADQKTKTPPASSG
jgi:hypothetical protein